MNLDPVDLKPAIVLGHTLEHDPPFGRGGDRHSCTRCGKAVLGSSYGIVYGSALTDPCPEPAVSP